ERERAPDGQRVCGEAEEESDAVLRTCHCSARVGMRESMLRYVRSSPRRLARTALVLGFLTFLVPHSALASKGLVLGLFDDSSTLGTTNNFPLLHSLHVQVVRMTLTWGGRGGVANRRPAHASDPADPAYDWSTYDRAVERANQAGIQVLFTIVGTPAWA